MVDTLASAFELEEENEELESMTAGSNPVRSFVGRSKRHSLKEKKGKVLFSFVAPTAGMFIWVCSLSLFVSCHHSVSADNLTILKHAAQNPLIQSP